jgi:hypothetical protein
MNPATGPGSCGKGEGEGIGMKGRCPPRDQYPWLNRPRSNLRAKRVEQLVEQPGESTQMAPSIKEVGDGAQQLSE